MISNARRGVSAGLYGSHRGQRFEDVAHVQERRRFPDGVPKRARRDSAAVVAQVVTETRRRPLSGTDGLVGQQQFRAEPRVLRHDAALLVVELFGLEEDLARDLALPTSCRRPAVHSSIT
jgi:hypothetical protein